MVFFCCVCFSDADLADVENGEKSDNSSLMKKIQPAEDDFGLNDDDGEDRVDSDDTGTSQSESESEQKS
jgi:hypothetical protein